MADETTRKIIRRRSAGDLEKLQYILWQAMKRAEDVMLDENVPNSVHLRAVHTASQVAINFDRISEAVELKRRIEALEGHRD